ncbi:MAG TPA: prolyl oligopeptidase family serine peptidase, partial [Planctomycetaceae bacterium]|nr:prolyl oligopeptidase family serine peptidase [Planctomycetaceae bacterium]
MSRPLIICLLISVCLSPPTSFAQKAEPQAATKLESELEKLQQKIESLRQAELAVEKDGLTRSRRWLISDVEVFAKAAEWILRHDEFYKPDYVQQTEQVLAAGMIRAEQFAARENIWGTSPGKSILGYYSEVDGSAQPYALTLPNNFDPDQPGRWPLHVVLHGRAATMNEVNFIARHDAKPAPKDQTWIQLDVFGRTNNAYRWSGETDVFEAIRNAQQRFRIDDKRITLHGFSMGGAGAWHLGLHHPSKWSSVGPGAGFVDTYKYQKMKEKLPDIQHLTLGIYDAVDYALNAANVPVCTYGGELDAQLLASTTTVDAAKELGVEIKLIVGPNMGHKFDPVSQQEFMKFHLAASEAGRPTFPGLRTIRFTTRTLKYNRCEWLTIEELIEQYQPTTVEGTIEDDQVHLTTENVAALKLSRDIARTATIDGKVLPLADAADNLLPDVLYVREEGEWSLVDYDQTRRFDANPGPRKRHELQGPIDDAFMDSFVCVRGTGAPWSKNQQAWSEFVLARFEREFDKWLRGKIRIVNDKDVTQEMIGKSHLILFGDPGSNSVIAQVLEELPVSWTKTEIIANGQTHDVNTRGLAMIYPNPLNRRRYVVINSGHTFHEEQFKASNA